MENWIPVVGFEGLYDVSNKGRIRSVERIYESGRCRRDTKMPQNIMKARADKDGYLSLGLRKNGVRYYRRVSRIVCEAFHPNPLNKPVVNHKNGVKVCNDDWNLEWATHSENEKHSYDVLGKKSKGNTGMNGVKNWRSRPLYQYTIDGTLVKKWESMNMAVVAGFTKKSLNKAVKKEFSHHRGFKWSR